MRSKIIPTVLMLLATLLLLSACGDSSPGAGNGQPPLEDEPPITTDPPPGGDPEVTYMITGQSIAARSSSALVKVHKAVGGVVDYANPVTTATVTANGGAPLTLIEATQGYHGDLGVRLNPGDVFEVTVTVDGVTVTGSGNIPADITQTAPTDGEVIPAGDPVVIEWTTPLSPDSYAFMIAWPGRTTWQYESDGSSRSVELQTEYIDYTGGLMAVQIVGFSDGTFSGDQVHPDSTLQLENRTLWGDRSEFTIELP